jgi:Recombinase
VSTARSFPRHRRPGRPPACPREIIVRVIELRRQGLSYRQISAVLNAAGVPTPLGRSQWLKSSVDRLLHTQYAKEILNQSAGELARGERVRPLSTASDGA